MRNLFNQSSISILPQVNISCKVIFFFSYSYRMNGQCSIVFDEIRL